MNPTPEQESIVAATRSSSSHIEVRAYAGTGKTSTICLLASAIKHPALAVAFNKSIAQELAKRLPLNFDCKTMNGLGHGALTRALPKLTLDDRKHGKLISANAKAMKLELLSDEWDQARRLLSLAISRGISYQNEGVPLVLDIPNAWNELADNLWLPHDSRDSLIELARLSLREANNQTRQGLICFDDQIYAPTVLRIGTLPTYPRVVVDEAQDLSPLQHVMIGLTLDKGALLIQVGDPKQAIYGFRGADSASMHALRTFTPGSWTTLPLTVTFRCPKVIVARQQVHAPGFQAHSSAPDGHFESWPRLNEPSAEATRMENWYASQLLDFGGSTAILCRNNAPLFSLAFKLLRQRIGVTMLGRDIGQGLKSLLKELRNKDDNPSVQTLSTRLLSWREREEDIARANDAPSKAEAIADRAESLVAIFCDAEVRDSKDAETAIDLLFSPHASRITLSSIHRSKGLEWDTVLHLDPSRLPSKASLKADAKGDPAPLAQEWNLHYVCETRAKRNLIEANLEDFS